MYQIFQAHFTLIFICGFIFFIILILFKIYKFKILTDMDQNWRKYENGQVIEECKSRNIWDYSFFPGLSRLWHQSEWQTAIAMFILLLLLCVYLYTKDEKLFNLLGLNFGVVIGMMLKR